MENKPVTNDEWRDMVRQAVTKCDDQRHKLSELSSKMSWCETYWNSSQRLSQSFDAQVSLLRTVITSLIWMVFISMVLNLGAFGALVYMIFKS